MDYIFPTDKPSSFDIYEYLSEVYYKLEDRKEFSLLINVIQNLLNHYHKQEYNMLFNVHIYSLEEVKIEIDKGEDHLKWLMCQPRKGKCSLNTLPEELFALIMDQVIGESNFNERLIYRLVNKRFKRAIDDYNSKKTRLTISGSGSEIFNVKELALELRVSSRIKDLFIIDLKTNGDEFNKLISEFGRLKYIHLMDIEGLDYKNFVRLAAVALQLESLEITGCNLDEDGLNMICFKLENLKRLNIERSDNISGYSLKYIKAELSDLGLEIDNKFDVNQTFKGLVTGNCVQLHSLDLRVSDFQNIDWSILKGLTKLETLLIEFSSCGYGNFQSLASLDGITTLSHIEVNNNIHNSITNHKNIVELTSKLVSLMDLSIESEGDHQLDISDDTVKSILINCKNLEEIKLKNTKISGKTFTLLLEFGHVKSLHIENAKKIDVNSVQNYIIYSQDIQRLTLINVGTMPPCIGRLMKKKAVNCYKKFSLQLNSVNNWTEDELNICRKSFEFEFD